MMSTKQWLMKTAGVGMFLTLVIFLCGNARSAGEVPTSWNVAPMTAGAYLASFDDTTTWASVGDSWVTNVFTPEITGLPTRSNTWFGANVKVLKLDTLRAVITNTLTHPSAGAISFVTDPMYIDMRVKFDAFVDPPDSNLLNSGKGALYMNANTNLVVVHNTGTATNLTTQSTSLWYQVTFKLYDSTKFDVLLNDVPVSEFTGLTVKSSAGTANILSAVQFNGTGYIDELYVSRGDPKYAIAGATTTIPTLPGSGTLPTAEQQTRLNKWLSGKTSVNNVANNLTRDKLNRAYLLDELPQTGGVANDQTCDFGISAIDVLSATSVKVTAQLKVNDSGKAGAINGKIVLLGKTAIADGSWTVMGTNAPPTFTAGKAEQTFTIPAGYKFFQTQIIAPE